MGHFQFHDGQYVNLLIPTGLKYGARGEALSVGFTIFIFYLNTKNLNSVNASKFFVFHTHALNLGR